MSEGFNVVYAKKGSRPYNKFFENKKDTIKFIFTEFDNIDFLSINEVMIDKVELFNKNIKFARYLKLKRIYEI
jgi:hypothetical protein